MKTAIKRKSGNRTLATIEMTPRGNLILRASKSAGNLEFKDGRTKRQGKAGAKRAVTRTRRSSTQATMEAAH